MNCDSVDSSNNNSNKNSQAVSVHFNSTNYSDEDDIYVFGDQIPLEIETHDSHHHDSTKYILESGFFDLLNTNTSTNGRSTDTYYTSTAGEYES